MGSSISKLTIVEGMLVFGLNPADSPLDDVLRRAVGALGSYSGEQFVADGRRAAAFMRGEISARQIPLSHPQFADATGYPNSWLSVAVDSFEPRPFGFVFL